LNAHYDEQKKHNLGSMSSGYAPYKGGKKGSGPLHPEVMERLAELKGERQSQYRAFNRSSFACALTYSADDNSAADVPMEGTQLATTSPGLSCSNLAETVTEVNVIQTPISRRHSGKNRQGYRKTHGTGSTVAKRRVALEEKFQFNLERNIDLPEKREEVLNVLVKAKEEKADFRREKLAFLKKEANKEMRFEKLLKAKVRIARESLEEMKRRK